MVILWYLVLGGLMAGYFALAGFDYGVGLLYRGLGRDDADRRRALNAVGPFFLGNEVWIVAAAGVLLAAFPRLEERLFHVAYPLVVALILGLVAVNAGVQLRSRGRWRRGFDGLILVASAVLAIGWGMLLGNLLTGLRPGAGLFGWYPWLGGLALLAILALHGAAYLAWRAPEPVAGRAAARAARLAPVAAAVTLVAFAGGIVAGVPRPVPAVLLGLLLLGALGLAWLATRRRRPGWAVAATAVAAALPVVLVGICRYPEIMPGLRVADGAAAGPTLHLLGVAALPLIPLLLAVQAAAWWAYRRRADRPAPSYW